MDTPGPTKPTAPGAHGPGSDAAFLALHAEREGLERELVRVQQLQKFGGEAGVEPARREEVVLLQALDRVLTRIRAAEYSRRPGARRW